MEKNIHGSEGCARCGACCVYFRITERKVPEGALYSIGPKPEIIFKEGKEVCKNLDYNFETKQASCKIYDAKRLDDCMIFHCGDCKEKYKEKLSEVAKRMSEIMKAHQAGLEVKIKV